MCPFLERKYTKSRTDIYDPNIIPLFHYSDLRFNTVHPVVLYQYIII